MLRKSTMRWKRDLSCEFERNTVERQVREREAAGAGEGKRVSEQC